MSQIKLRNGWILLYDIYYCLNLLWINSTIPAGILSLILYNMNRLFFYLLTDIPISIVIEVIHSPFPDLILSQWQNSFTALPGIRPGLLCILREDTAGAIQEELSGFLSVESLPVPSLITMINSSITPIVCSYFSSAGIICYSVDIVFCHLFLHYFFLITVLVIY